MPVSELEKNPDNRMSATSTENRRPSGASFNSGVNPQALKKRYLEEKTRREQAPIYVAQGNEKPLSNPLQHQFEHHLGAKIGQHQQGKAR